jgi:hypothetical protein
MNKIGAILFLIKAVTHIAYRIIRGRTWNMIVVDLEEQKGRLQLTYRRGLHDYELHEWYRGIKK